MPKFGKLSKSRLELAHADIQMVCNEAIGIIDFTVLCTFRNKEKQIDAFNNKRSKLFWPQSNHNKNPSWAIDVAPYYKNKPHIRWPVAPNQMLSKNLYEEELKRYVKETALFYSLGSVLMTIAKSYGIKWRWGGDWDSDWDFTDQKFDDLVHHELGF